MVWKDFVLFIDHKHASLSAKTTFQQFNKTTIFCPKASCRF